MMGSVRPLVHFLVLGACLFGLLHWRAWLAADDEARELRRPPQAAEVEARTDAELFDELLYREALLRGLGQHVVQVCS